MKAAQRTILLTVFLDIAGFGILIPQLGVYATQFGASGEVIGALQTSYTLMQFLFAPFWGRLSDRVGRRPILLTSIFGSGMGYVVFAFSHSLPVLFAARIIDGITGANISVAQTYLTDVTPAAERSKVFGMVGAAFGVGFVVGPAIGLAMGRLPGIWGGNFGLGMLTAALSFANWYMGLRRLPETLPEAARERHRERVAAGKSQWQLFDIQGVKQAFQIPGLNILMLVAFFSIFAFANLQSTFTPYIISTFVRPTVQTLIRTSPQAAADEAAHRLETGQSAQATGLGSLSNAKPYSASMGGDFNPPIPERDHLQWRAVEQALVQPRAIDLNSKIFTFIGIISCIVQGGLIGSMRKRHGEVNLVIMGTFLMSIGLALVPLAHTFNWLFPIVALLSYGNGISTPVITSLVSHLSPEAERGEIIGVFQSVQSLARIVGPLLGGALFDVIGHAAPYLVGGALMLFACFIALGLRKAPHHYEQAHEPSRAEA